MTETIVSLETKINLGTDSICIAYTDVEMQKTCNYEYFFCL
jgi:hypothetical protein